MVKKEVKKEVNEFEDLDSEDLEDSESEEHLPPMNDSDEELEMAKGSAGKVYDYTKAPESIRAPERIDLDGKTVVINKAELIMLPHKPFVKSKDGKMEYRSCPLKLFYDFEGQQEFYSGARQFKTIENGKEVLGHPTIWNDEKSKSQAHQLMKKYAEFKGKDIKEVSLKEFMAFLNSKPKAILKSVEVEFDNKVTKKNLVDKFIN